VQRYSFFSIKKKDFYKKVIFTSLVIGFYLENAWLIPIFAARTFNTIEL